MTRDEERRSLLDAVHDSPDDDAPRLVYADWLEEYGDVEDAAQAEFIRGAGAHTFAVADFVGGWQYSDGSGLSVPQIRFCFGTLDRAGGDSWPVDSAIIFRRGFVEEVRAPLAVLLEYGPAILRQHPVTRMVATGREPIRGESGWHWSFGIDGSSDADPSGIPGDVMVGGGLGDDVGLRAKRFRSREAALELALEYCRELARKEKR